MNEELCRTKEGGRRRLGKKEKPIVLLLSFPLTSNDPISSFAQGRLK